MNAIEKESSTELERSQRRNAVIISVILAIVGFAGAIVTFITATGIVEDTVDAYVYLVFAVVSIGRG